MRSIATSAMLLAFLGASALAEDVTVTPPAPAPGVVVRHDRPDANETHKKVVIRKDENGCTSKTVKKSDEMGNSETHTKSNC